MFQKFRGLFKDLVEYLETAAVTNRDKKFVMNYIFLFIIAFFGSVITATIGFGSALVVLSFSTLFWEYKTLVGIVTVYFFANNIFKLFFYGKRIHWKTAGLVLLGSLPLVVLGAFLLVQIPTETLKRILGGIVLFYVINYQFTPLKKYRPQNFHIPLIGAVYGFFSGMIGVADPIKAALLNQVGLVKEEFIATMTIIAFIQNFFKISIYSHFQLVSSRDWLVILGLIIVSLAGVYVGSRIIKKIPVALFKKIVLIMLAIIGIKLLIWG